MCISSSTPCGFTKDVYKRQAKYKAEHETELKQFYAARRKLTGEFPDGKVDMKKLTEEYDLTFQRRCKSSLTVLNSP